MRCARKSMATRTFTANWFVIPTLSTTETDVCSEPTTSKRLTETRAIWPLSIQHSGGVIGGVLSSKPPQPEIATPWRVRISSGVAVGLLVKTVPPDYPDLAKQKRVQGR